MLDPKSIEAFIQQVMDTLPEGLCNLPNDLKQNLRMGLQGALSRLDVVSREEFDTQVAVLKRTRKKLDELEATLDAMQDQKNS